jgi:hypothetical protein
MKRSQNNFTRSSSNKPYNNFKNTARLTNSVNLTAFRAFNNWGGMSYADILSTYPPHLIEKAWNYLAREVIENYQMGKGTFIKGFGTFTFTDVEFSLEGTTNQYSRDIKRRRPVFIVSNEFIDYLKPAIYTNVGGLIPYNQKIYSNVSIVKINYASLSYGINVSKEEYMNILNTLIKKIGDDIRRREFKNKYFPNVGVFLIRNDLFGMKFEDEIYNESSLKNNKYYGLKKNLNLFMETKDSQKERIRNINDIDEAEREVRPSTAVLTKITPSGDMWLKNQMDIDIRRDLNEEPREDFFVKNPIKKPEYFVDQRPYRSYPKQHLGYLNISQDILEAILNNKYYILRDMKLIDTHGDGLIPKYDFIYSFARTNIIRTLRIEMIEKITNLYLNNDPSIIMIKYKKLVDAICRDIKELITFEYKNFPINKYKYTIDDNNKRIISAYGYSSLNGNLNNKALNSIDSYSKNFNNIENDEINNDLFKIKKAVPYFQKTIGNINKMVSYLELINLLQVYRISINKVQMLKICKHCGIKNPNAFNLKEFIEKVGNEDNNNKKLIYNENNQPKFVIKE